jgi:hypothetical protein
MSGSVEGFRFVQFAAKSLSHNILKETFAAQYLAQAAAYQQSYNPLRMSILGESIAKNRLSRPPDHRFRPLQISCRQVRADFGFDLLLTRKAELRPRYGLQSPRLDVIATADTDSERAVCNAPEGCFNQPQSRSSFAAQLEQGFLRHAYNAPVGFILPGV